MLLTPHIGGSTAEAQANIGVEVAEKLVRYSDNGSTMSAVNFPEVSLPEHGHAHRVLHIHHNEPGILLQLNGILSRNDVNISAQYLRTNENIGYVVTDIDEAHGREILAELNAIPGTIRTRILF